MKCVFTITLLTVLQAVYAQESNNNPHINVSDKQLQHVNKKVAGLDKKLTRQWENYLNSASGKFDKLSSGEYIAGLDSLQGALAFLKD